MSLPRRAVVVALGCALTLGSARADAQLAAPAQLHFERLSVEQGLSQSVIRDIEQGDKGFLWIATQNGLNVYDGYRFTVFKHDPADVNSLPNSSVTSLAMTSGPDGFRVWAGTIRGLAAYDPAHHRFTRYLHESARPDGLTHDSITALLVDRSGVLWVGTQRGLNRYDAASKAIVRVPLPLSNPFISAMVEDADGALWVGTGAGLNRIDPTRADVTTLLHDAGNAHSLSDNFIRSLLVDRRGRLWVGTDNGGLDRLDAATGHFIHHVHGDEPGRLSGNSVNAILEDARGDLWVGIWGGGVNRMVPSEAGPPRFIAYRHDPSDPESLSVDDVNVLVQDRSGAIWVGTYGGGVNRFVPDAADNFAHYKHVPRNPGSLGDNRVYALLVDRDGVLWVGTWGGLYRLRRGAASFDRFLPDGRPGSISDIRVTSLAQRPDGTVWIGTLDGGINRYDAATHTFRHYRHVPGRAGTLSSDRVTALAVDRAGVLWAGTLTSGVNRLDPSTGIVTRVVHEPGDAATLSDGRIHTIFEDSLGTLWVGTAGGLDLVDRATGRVTRVARLPDVPAALGGLVVSIAESPARRFWIGTDNGLVRLDITGSGPIDWSRPKPATFRIYLEADGLSNPRVHRALPDSAGHIWITTDNGLTRLRASDGATTVFDATDGLQGNEFKSGGFFDAATGRMFVGGLNGFNVFRPAAVQPRTFKAPVVLTGMTILNQPVPIGPGSPLDVRIADAERVTLTHRDDVFSFEFAALDYVASRRMRYAYMLAGFDRTWNQTDATRRFATYTNLSPATYTFLVRAGTQGDEWGEPRRLTVVILPPFWSTWWFRTVVALTVVLGFLAAHQRRVRAVERQRNELERLVARRTGELQVEKERVVEALRAAEDASAAKTKFLANASHEIRTPLNAIVGMADVLAGTALDAEQRQYVGTLTAAGDALAELIDDTLDLSKIEVGRYEVERAPFDLRRFVRDTVMVVAAEAKRKQLAVECAVDDALPATVSGDARALRRVLLNLLGNALRFTPAGRIAVRVARAGDGADRVRFEVSDTGIGIPADKHERIFDPFAQADVSTARKYGGSGLGLALCRQLVELMGGDISVASEPGEGSRFSFVLPLPESAQPSPPVGVGAARPTAAVRPLRVLLVEDSAPNRVLVEAYLKDTPHALTVVETGEAAVEACRAGGVDIVLMDLNLPGISGYDAARRIRGEERDAGRAPVPIVALTAHAFADDVEHSRRAGCDEHLAKPIRQAVLLQVLDRYSHRTEPVPASSELPPELVAYVPEYLAIARRELDAALAALEHGDPVPLRTLGHKLKGSAASFGLDEVGIAAGRVERSADGELRASAVALDRVLKGAVGQP